VLPTFVIVLREAFEAALLLGIVYTYLQKIGRPQHYRYVTAGAVLGILASIATGVAVSYLSGPLLDLGPDLVTAGILFLSVAVLTWMLVWMQQHARAIKGDVQRRIDEAESRSRLWVIATVAFAGVFREGAETVLFVWGLLTQAAAGAGGASLVGGVLGVAVAAVLALAIFNGSRAVSLPTFFSVTSVLLLLLAAGLFSAGVGRLQGLGLLPLTGELWDTSWLLDEGSLVGTLLHGLAGYRSRPTALEFGAWVLYLLVAGALLFGSRPTRRSSPRSEIAREATPSNVHQPS
jgi:high-affinity iron transporter